MKIEERIEQIINKVLKEIKDCKNNTEESDVMLQCELLALVRCKKEMKSSKIKWLKKIKKYENRK